MNQQNSKKDKQINNTLRKDIKKKPYPQQIDGITYTYSLLQKKKKTLSISSTQRFLLLKGCEELSYARNLPDNLMIPFKDANSFPQMKMKVPLSKINVSVNQDVLLVTMQDQSTQKWQFVCGNKNCAINWCQHIEKAIKDMQENNKPIKIQLNDPINQKQKIEQQQIQGNKMKQITHEMSKAIDKKQDIPQTNQQNNKKNNMNNMNNNYQTNKIIHQQQEEIPISYNLKQKQQSKPTSSFYLGGISVDSEKEQLQLKNQTNSILLSTSKLKSQYNRKKKEEENIKQEINSSDIFSILKITADQKYNLQNLKRNWSYEFVKSIHEQQIINSFKIYVQIITHRIINQLGLEESKKSYKPIEQNIRYFKYKIDDDIYIKLLFTELQQVSLSIDKHKGTIVSCQNYKKAQQQMKNYDYLLQITKNKGMLRVPLTMMIEYKGLTAIAQARIPEGNNLQNTQQLHRQLLNLQSQSHIYSSIFEQQQCIKIVPAQSKIFEKLSRMDNNPQKFDICYITDAQNYLPHDFYRSNKNSAFQQLRKEIILDEQLEQQVFYGNNMAMISNQLKIPQNYVQGIQQLRQIASSIPYRVAQLGRNLQNIDQIITNSKEISEIMHLYGLNVRYLGLLLEKLRLPWLRAIIMSEIICRCIKHLYKFELQQNILNMNEKNIEEVFKLHKQQTINFINKTLGNGNQTNAFWKQINKQAQMHFRVSIDKQGLNRAYLMQSLQHNCRFRFSNLPKHTDLFKSSNLFTIDNLSDFWTNYKVYDLSFTELYRLVQQHLSDLSAQSYEQLRMVLNLSRRSSVAQHFKFNGMYDKILTFLANWLNPKQAKSIYYPQEIQIGSIMPSRVLYTVKLTEMKWALKKEDIEKSQEIFRWMINHVNEWLAPYHPILTELYDIYAHYYGYNKQNQHKAINYCKSSIHNQQKLIGLKHIKLADNYYTLGEIYMNYNHQKESLTNFRKAKQILTQNENINSQAYGKVCLKMAQLCLALSAVQQSLELSIDAMQKLSESDNLSDCLSAIELICRCYEVCGNWESYVTFSGQHLIPKLHIFADEPFLFDCAIKATITPYLHHITTSTTVCARMIHLLQQLQSNAKSSTISYNYLKTKMQEGIFPQVFVQYLGDVQEILDEIESNAMMSRWKGFQSLNKAINNSKMGPNFTIRNKGYEFIGTMQALNIFLGGNFIDGILSE